MNRTSIEWTDFSANPLKYRRDGKTVWACIKTSPGCAHCYSEAIALRFDRGKVFNAANMEELEPFLDQKELRRMLSYKPASGKRCFLGDMTDLFGEWVPDALLNQLFSEVLEVRTDVTWQILTKRAKRMHEYLSWRWGEGRIPSRNIHVGVSVEDQQRADERVPLLLKTPAAVRFISAEPLLGPVDLRLDYRVNAADMMSDKIRERLDWVIVGGESGKGASPCDVAWIRSLVRQCRAAGVPVFVKQLGSVVSWDGCQGGYGDAPSDVWPRETGVEQDPAMPGRFRKHLVHPKGGDIAEFPEDLQVRQYPEVTR